jgi:hypothetical protein
MAVLNVPIVFMAMDQSPLNPRWKSRKQLSLHLSCVMNLMDLLSIELFVHLFESTVENSFDCFRLRERVLFSLQHSPRKIHVKRD